MGSHQLFQQGGHRTVSGRNGLGRPSQCSVVRPRSMLYSPDAQHGQLLPVVFAFGRQPLTTVLSFYEVKTCPQRLFKECAQAWLFTFVHPIHNVVDLALFRALVNESLVTVFHAHLRHIDQGVSLDFKERGRLRKQASFRLTY